MKTNTRTQQLLKRVGACFKVGDLVRYKNPIYSKVSWAALVLKNFIWHEAMSPVESSVHVMDSEGPRWIDYVHLEKIG